MEHLHMNDIKNITCGPLGGTGRIAVSRAKDKMLIRILEKERFEFICQKQYLSLQHEELKNKYEILNKNFIKLEFDNMLLKKENESLTLLNKSIDNLENPL